MRERARGGELRAPLPEACGDGASFCQKCSPSLSFQAPPTHSLA